MTIVSLIQPFLSLAPPLLQDRVLGYWQQFVANLGRKRLSFKNDKIFLQQIVRVWAASDYVAQHTSQNPQLLLNLYRKKSLLNTFCSVDYRARFKRKYHLIHNQADLEKQLRLFRQQQLIRIIWRDINQLSDFYQTSRELTMFADVCINETINLLQNWLHEKYGLPCNMRGRPQNFCVIALGKLGGFELNLSSDIDLIFCYPDTGETNHPTQRISNEQFFTILARQLIYTLSNIDARGFVFRVDMRLRPFGSDGALVTNFSGLQDYYKNYGRNWERYALVKARIIHANQRTRKRLMRIIHRFVYHPYLDYTAINALREMKSLMRKEAQSQDLKNNIKRGEGGIREVEFIIQMFQLVHGGCDLFLQNANLSIIFEHLKNAGYISRQLVEKLQDAYMFLRNSENRLQAINDRQTQRLPDDALKQQQIAFAMGFDDWSSFKEKVDKTRRFVKLCLDEVFANPHDNHVIDEFIVQQAELQRLWMAPSEQQENLIILTKCGFLQPVEILTMIADFVQIEQYLQLEKKMIKKLNVLMPVILEYISLQKNQQVTFKRVLSVVEKILLRISLLNLLLAQQSAIEQLVKLCSASPWITNELAAHPILLEDLVDSRTLYAPLDRATLSTELRQYLIGTPLESLRQQMNALRRFTHTHLLRVAAADIANVLPLMKVSDHLTFTACVILQEIQNISQQFLVARHGFPTDEQGHAVEQAFTIIAYGKLGGIELGYGSDLDLVFLHDNDYLLGQTNGPHPISNEVFYTRLAQQIVQFLNSRTTEGILYEVDTRLRPSGSAGLLVNSFHSFSHYQLNKAWTWEHQALVRARAVTGNASIQEKFYRLREMVLSLKREQNALSKSVSEMRQKMRHSLLKVKTDYFDVKQGLGGITDIEFLVQYLVLHYSYQYPQLYEFSDNIRILEAIEYKQILPQSECAFLAESYRQFRAIVHRCDLQNEEVFIKQEDFLAQRQEIARICQSILGKEFLQ